MAGFHRSADETFPPLWSAPFIKGVNGLGAHNIPPPSPSQWPPLKTTVLSNAPAKILCPSLKTLHPSDTSSLQTERQKSKPPRNHHSPVQSAEGEPCLTCSP